MCGAGYGVPGPVFVVEYFSSSRSFPLTPLYLSIQVARNGSGHKGQVHVQFFIFLLLLWLLPLLLFGRII